MKEICAADFADWIPKIDMASENGIYLFLKYEFPTSRAIFIVKCNSGEYDFYYLDTAIKIYNMKVRESYGFDEEDM